MHNRYAYMSKSSKNIEKLQNKVNKYDLVIVYLA